MRGYCRSAAVFSITAITVALLACGASAQTDELIREAIAEAGSAEDHNGAECVVVFDRTDSDVEESGLAHVRRHELIKILTEEGAVSQAVRRFDYDPASNFIRIDGIRIFRVGGGIEVVDPAAAHDLFAPAHAIYWGARMKIIGLPRLEPGDAVEIRTYKKGFEIAYLGADEEDSRYMPPMRGHYYDSVIFQGDHPVLEKRYDLHLPVGKEIQYEVYNGTLYSSRSFDGEKIHYSWWRLDIPAISRETRMPALSDISTKLVLATVSSWEEKSKWFDAIHDTIFDDNDEIRAKALELTRGLNDDVEKAAALQHWAAQEIRYSGISMGEGEGYTIHPGWMIFEDRCGVCKDKAGMLITLMRSAGYEVYPALTMAGARVERIPADQFNHCVVAWKRDDGSYTMLDPTWVVNSTELWSSAEQEQNYVIGTPWGEDLMITPYSHPENHVLKIVSSADIDAEGNLSGNIRISASNYMDQRMRRYVGGHRKDDLKGYIEGWFAGLSRGVVIEECETGDPLDFDSEFVLSVRYSIPRYAAVWGESVDFVSPAWNLAIGNGTLFTASTVVGLEERKHPLFIWFTQTLECEEKVRLPKGYAPAGLAGRIERKGEYASFEAERSFSGRVLTDMGKALIKHRTIPAPEYGGFKAVVDMVEEYGTERIVAARR